ncbi:helix-turn-helix domain-containing protein [Isoptericola sp. b441]|uniref:Helix-turn-helix domain-containing protein n=1 Tax=Actinotalea lenta TaxID=3064654 RepID=A0ABT9DC04_9CELL|nr:helix-turn-helix domain-containing protein [Isoptericola sp. b441]MDO8108425.1 helix-turn-helix domain-containing protein [Isoptericola sp. b441]
MAESTIRTEEIATREDLARALTAVRESRGMTVREVAAAAHTPAATVGGYLTGRHLPPLAAMDSFRRVLDALGVAPQEQEAWADVVGRLRRAPGRRPANSPAPYRGLVPYEPEDAAVFVGREALTASLLGRVVEARRPVVVLGPSGCGKSSLLRAGLVAELRGAGYTAVVVTPTGLREEARELPTGAVLVVDQLEEAFGTGRGHPQELVEELARAAERGVRVVVALRADFFDRALEVEPMPGWLAHGPVIVEPLTAADLRRVVLEPARAMGIEVEEALVDVLLAEATAGIAAGRFLDAGALPLVSHALYVTWATSPGHRLTLAHYREAGGFSGAIAKTAEDVFADLSPAQQELARRILLRLVQVRDGAPDTRRAADRRELASPDAIEVLDACIAARLVTSDLGRVQLAHEVLLTAWPRLQEWLEADRDRLRVRGRLSESVEHWVAADRNPDLLYRGSALDSVQALTATGDDVPELTEPERAFVAASLEARRLREVRRRRSARRLRVLAGSLAIATVAVAALAVVGWLQNATLHRERDLAVSRQLAVTSRTLAQTDPATAAQVALAALDATNSVEARSALLSASGRTPVARLAQLDGIVNSLAAGPGGGALAVGTQNHTVQLWSTADPARRLADLVVGDQPIYAVTFAGSVLLAGGGDGVLRAWDTSDPGAPRAMRVQGADVGTTIYGLAVDTTDRLVAAGVNDGTVRLWRLAGTTLLPLSTIAAFDGTVQSVVFDASTLMAAGSDGLLGRWDVTDPTSPVSLGAPVTAADGHIASLDVSPDGTTVAVGSWDQTVHLWDVSDPASPVAGATLRGPASWVNGVRFSPDGREVAAASSDKHLWTWDVSTGVATHVLPSPALQIATAWAPDGSELYGAGGDGALSAWSYPGPALTGLGSVVAQPTTVGDVTVTATADGLRLWDVSDPENPRTISLTPAPEGVRLDGALDVSPELGLVVAGDRDGALVVWDISDPRAPVLLGTRHAHTSWVETVDVDPTGTRVALSDDDGTVSLWDLSSGLPEAPTAVIDAGGMVYSAYFSPDGRTLVTAILTLGTVQLYDVRDLADPRPLGPALTGPDGYVYHAVFSPDGRTVAASGNDGTVWLWDVTDPTAPVQLGTPLRWGDGYAMVLAFSPDGTRLAGAMTDGTLRLWDVTSLEHPTRFATLEGGTGTVYGVVYSPDGSHVSSAGSDRTVRIYATSLRAASAEICRQVRRGVAMTPTEWEQLAGDLPLPQLCS